MFTTVVVAVRSIVGAAFPVESLKLVVNVDVSTVPSSSGPPVTDAARLPFAVPWGETSPRPVEPGPETPAAYDALSATENASSWLLGLWNETW